MIKANLFADPVPGLVNVPVEHLDLVRLLEGVGLLLGHLLQLCPLLVQVLKLSLEMQRIWFRYDLGKC